MKTRRKDLKGLEAKLREVWPSKDFHTALKVALQGTDEIVGFGPEFYGVVKKLRRNNADDVYQDFCLDLWRQMERFRWQSSFRTWAYRILKGHVVNDIRAPRVPVTDPATSRILGIAAESRTPTAPWQQTAVKNRIRERFERILEERVASGDLEPEDRLMLILRDGRNFSWEDVARVLEEGASSSTEIESAADKWKKRRSRLKPQIEAWYRQARTEALTES